MKYQSTYPDSVNRVKPPKITIPKTLAALPSSQYATALSLILGKLDLVLAAPCSIVSVTAGAAADRRRLEVKNWRFLSIKRVDWILQGSRDGIEPNRRVDLAA